MNNFNDPGSPSLAFNRHDESLAASRVVFDKHTRHTAGETMNDQSAAEDHSNEDSIEETSRPQPVAGGTWRSATTLKNQDEPTQTPGIGMVPQRETREYTRWHHHIKKVDVWETKVGLLPPSRGVPMRMVVLATG